MENVPGIREFAAYDEPFNPKLIQMLPANHEKQTWDEFIDLWRANETAFRRFYIGIPPENEANRSLSTEEIMYLRWLNTKRTIIDFTRINFRLLDVLKVFPNLTLVSLFRSPVAFSSSHLINSENTKFARQFFYRAGFFSRFSSYDSWGMGSLSRADSFETLVEQFGIKPKSKINRLKGYEKLLLIWLVARREADTVAKSEFAERFFISSYEDIIEGDCRQLGLAMGQVGIESASLDRSHLKAYSKGYRPSDVRWFNAMQRVGFTEFEINKYHR